MNTAARLAFVAAIALTALACGDPRGPTAPGGSSGPIAADFDFAAIGSGKALITMFSGTVLVDADARTVRPLEAQFGALSPDAKSIAYERLFGDIFDPNYGYDIFVSDLDGSNEAHLTTFHNNMEAPPSWSADGSSLLFATDFDFNIPLANPASQPGIYRVSRTACPTQIARFPVDAMGYITCPTVGGGGSGTHVSEHATGVLAFACQGGGIYVTGTQSRRVFAVNVGDQVGTPVWSADGTRLAFTRGVADTTRLYVIDAASGAEVSVIALPVPGTATYEEPSICWLKAANTFLFVAGDSEHSALYSVPVAGAPIRKVADRVIGGLSCVG